MRPVAIKFGCMLASSGPLRTSARDTISTSRAQPFLPFATTSVFFLAILGWTWRIIGLPVNESGFVFLGEARHYVLEVQARLRHGLS
jgi:hypothetical protein